MMNRLLRKRPRRVDRVHIAAIIVVGCLLYIITSLALLEEPGGDDNVYYDAVPVDSLPSQHRLLRSDSDDIGSTGDQLPSSDAEKEVVGFSAMVKKMDEQSEEEEDADTSSVTTEEKKTAVNIYNVAGGSHENLSVFRTDFLERYGSGKVTFNFKARNSACRKCSDDKPSVAESLVPRGPCLAVTRWAPPSTWKCDIDSLKCNYPNCKTMV